MPQAATADASGRVKPSVGILYSDDDKNSLESQNLAYYIAALLASSGYSIIYLVGSSGKSTQLGKFTGRLYYTPPGYNVATPIEAPTADITHEQWSILPTCDLVVVTVNGIEVTSSMEKLADVLKGVKRLAVLSLQRGVKNSSVVKDELAGKVSGATVLEAVVGFGVVTATSINGKAYPAPSPVYVPTVAASSIGCALERIPKESFDVLDGPMRLLEVLPGLHFLYRKTLTPLSWGVLLFESLYAVNMLTGGTLLQTIRSRDARVLFAAMLRESRQALRVAARGGAWRPDMSLSLSTALFMMVPGLGSSGDGQLWLLEMLLLLPDWLWFLCGVDWWYLSLPRGVAPASSPSGHSRGSRANIIVSPGQSDWMHGRSSMTRVHLSHLVESGGRHGHDMYVCKAVLNSLRRLEHEALSSAPAVAAGSAADDLVPFRTTELSRIAKELLDDRVIVQTNENTKETPVSASTTRTPIVLGRESGRELLYYGARAVAVVVLLGMLLYVLATFTYDDGLPEDGDVPPQTYASAV